MGTMKVPSVTREDVERFMHRIAEGATRKRVKTGRKRGLSNVRGGKGTASRTVGLLSAIFTYAQRKRMITEHPVRGVKRLGISLADLMAAVKAIRVEAVEKVRSVGPNRAGGRGSYTIYRVAEAGDA